MNASSDNVAPGSAIRRYGLLLATAAPFALLLAMTIRHASGRPRWDDWTFVYGAIRYLGDSWNWSYIFAKQGVHLCATTKLHYYAIGRFANWNLLAGVGANMAAVAALFGGVVILIRRTLPKDGAGMLFYPLAALCAFSLCQWPLYFATWGILWMAVSLCLRLGILAADSKIGLAPLTAALCVLAALGSFTTAAGFTLWLAFPVYLVLSGRVNVRPFGPAAIRGLGVFAVGAAAILVLMLLGHGELNEYDREANYLALVETEEYSPLGWCLRHPLKACAFIVCVLGSSAGHGLDSLLGREGEAAHLLVAGVSGTMTLALFLGLLIYARGVGASGNLLRRLSPWLTIALMELATAGLVMIGRAGSNTLDRALSPHYGLVGLEFQFAVFAGAFVVWRHFRDEGGAEALRGSVAGLMPRFGRGLQIAAGFFVAFHLAGLIPAAREIVEDAEARKSQADAGWFARVMPEILLPLPYRKAGIERLELMDKHGAVDIASQEEIAALLASAQTNPAPPIPNGPPRVEMLSQGPDKPVVLAGQFIYAQPGPYDGAHPVVATLVLPNGAEALVSAVAQPTGMASQAGPVFQFQVPLAANPFAAARVKNANALLLDERRFVRVFEGVKGVRQTLNLER